MKEFIEKLIGRLEELKELHEELIKDGLSVEYHSGCKALSEDAIEIVNELAEKYKDKDCSKCSRRSWYQIGYADAEKKFAEEHKGGWIPCSERLPKIGTLVLAITESGNVCDDVLIYDYMHSGKKEPCFHRWDDEMWDCYTPRVIAWQPLPTPYQPKGEQYEQ